jgi:hypothetical protein
MRKILPMPKMAYSPMESEKMLHTHSMLAGMAKLERTWINVHIPTKTA